MNRRQLIKGIGAVICAGAVPAFVPSLIPKSSPVDAYLRHVLAHQRILASPATRRLMIETIVAENLLNHIEAHRAIIAAPMCSDREFYLLPTLGS